MLNRREFLVAAAVAGTAAACGLFGEDDHRTISYGEARAQFGHLYLPDNDSRGTVVLVHGGAWAPDKDLSLVTPVAKDLKSQGYTVWSVEYRRLGEEGGGWPGTFEDVGAAIDFLPTLAEDEEQVDPDHVVVVGHSAGGTLALWSGSQGDAAVTPLGIVSLAGFTDLAACVEEDLLTGACSRVMGGTPDQVPDHYAEASPIELLPLGIRQSLVHGEEDDIVPVRQSEDYVVAAQAAGDAASFHGVPAAGHFQLIDVGHPAYHEVVRVIGDLMTASAP